MTMYCNFHTDDNLSGEARFMRVVFARLRRSWLSNYVAPEIDKNTRASGEIPRLYVRPAVP